MFVILDWDTPCYSLLQLAFAHGPWCTLDLPTANVARIEEAASLCLGISSAQRPEADRPAKQHAVSDSLSHALQNPPPFRL